MGAKYGTFKYSVNTIIDTNGRNIAIIDREYREKVKLKNGKQFIANEKYYKYRCLNCGNEDWILEDSLYSQNIGCNACCRNARKVIPGINDISTTEPWITKYLKDKDDGKKYTKYSKSKVAFICPDCGLISIKPIMNVTANKSYSCDCSDGRSYPNKIMYSILSQLNVDFETEKTFDWSEKKLYDFYFSLHGYNIIIEMNGLQHYENVSFASSSRRSLEEEIANDKFKLENAKRNLNNIMYFSVDCRVSEISYIISSIDKSGLYNFMLSLGFDIHCIDFVKCEEYATKNICKEICLCKSKNNEMTLHDIAKKYKVSYNFVLRSIKKGNKFGWCNYKLNSDRDVMENNNRVNHGSKPIYCVTTNTYYRNANDIVAGFSIKGIDCSPRAIRKSISRNSMYKGYKFIFVTEDEYKQNVA